ncbi:flavin reductase family protein [Allokutzneria oryzae]|uniref:Flavin reductase family protein n=1 Tax=Allokutzneria oryzae TaxID=1378989 RepID=A0ABV5ZN61_9PSEU
MNTSYEVTSTGFRSLMAGFPTGVAVLTTNDLDGTPWGMTCSSVCSVSLEPPTLLVCVRNGSPTLGAMLRQGTFAVNLLHDGARPTAELFASGDPERFDRVQWAHGPSHGGPHLVDDAHAVADCRVSRTQTVGDHIVVFGEVFTVTHQSGPHPLLYGMRQYAAWPAS